MHKTSSLFGILFCFYLVAESLPLASVIVIRHCSRAPADDIKCVGQGYSTNRNDYVASPWPQYPVAPYMCTPRGLEIVKAEGASFYPTLPRPINFIADEVQRDIDTATSLADGMTLPHSVVTVNGSFFDPVRYKICSGLTIDQQNAAIKNHIAIIPQPQNYNSLMDTLQRVLGNSREPPITQIPNGVWNGYFSGGICVASDATENFLFELGAGLPLGWGNVSLSDMYDLLTLRSYWFEVNYGAFEVAQVSNSNILYNIAKDLNTAVSQNSSSTTFYVGHDTTIDGVGALLDLTWPSPPYPFNSTSPGSGLRFDVELNSLGQPEVSVNFFSTTFSDTDGKLTVDEAIFSEYGNSRLSLDLFLQLVNKVIDKRCIQA